MAAISSVISDWLGRSLTCPTLRRADAARRSRALDGSESLVIHGHGLVPREWNEADVPAMVGLFDTDEMDRWTPLAHPFDAEVAVGYIRRAHEARATGTLQLADHRRRPDAAR